MRTGLQNVSNVLKQKDTFHGTELLTAESEPRGTEDSDVPTVLIVSVKTHSTEVPQRVEPKRQLHEVYACQPQKTFANTPFYKKQDNVHTNTESVQCISIVYGIYYVRI